MPSRTVTLQSPMALGWRRERWQSCGDTSHLCAHSSSLTPAPPCPPPVPGWQGPTCPWLPPATPAPHFALLPWVDPGMMAPRASQGRQVCVLLPVHHAWRGEIQVLA